MIEFGHTVREVVSNLALQLDFIQDTVNSVVPKVRGVAPPGYTELLQQVKKTFFLLALLIELQFGRDFSVFLHKVLCFERKALNIVLTNQVADAHREVISLTIFPSKIYMNIYFQFKVDGEWWTWIDYERFQELVQIYEDSGGQRSFSALDYVSKTPLWALFGAQEQGFDPDDTRFQRRSKTKDISGC